MLHPFGLELTRGVGYSTSGSYPEIPMAFERSCGPIRIAPPHEICDFAGVPVAPPRNSVAIPSSSRLAARTAAAFSVRTELRIRTTRRKRLEREMRHEN